LTVIHVELSFAIMQYTTPIVIS